MEHSSKKIGRAPLPRPRKSNRVRLPPHLRGDMPDEGLIGWLHKYAKKQLWRVEGLCSYQDLIQEGWVIYAYCRQKYGYDLEPQHFMRLFQIAFVNQVNDLSKKRTKNSNEVLHSDIILDPEMTSEHSALESYMGQDDEWAPVLRVVAEAPWAVKQVLQLYFTDLVELLRSPSRRPDGTRETMNERFCKLVGFNPEKVDLATRVREYLRPSM